jgi:hypothetical protein
MSEPPDLLAMARQFFGTGGVVFAAAISLRRPPIALGYRVFVSILSAVVFLTGSAVVGQTRPPQPLRDTVGETVRLLRDWECVCVRLVDSVVEGR